MLWSSLRLCVLLLLYSVITECEGQDLQITPADDQYLRFGSFFSFECSSSGRGLMSNPIWLDPLQKQIYELGQGGSASRYVESSETLSILYFDGMIESYSGIYTCKAGDISASVTVNFYRGIEFVNAPPKQDLVAGREGFIDCAVTGTPLPTVTWKFNNQDLPIDGRYVPTERLGLGITNVSLVDEGTYSCRARMPTLGYTDKRDIFVDVLVPPRVTQAPQNTTGNEGQSAKLTCTAVGDPFPNIRWMFRGVHLENPIKYKLSDQNRTLTIQNLKEEDTGEYTCRAENKVSWDEGRGYVTVNIRPVIGLTQNSTQEEKGFVEFTCYTIRGSPRPSIRWRRGPINIQLGRQPHDNRINVYENAQKGMVLTINSVGRLDIGTYTCIAENVAGYDQDDFHLDVMYRPEVDEAKTRKTQKSWVNNPTNITCVIYSNPQAKFSWTRFQKPLNITNHIVHKSENGTSLFLIPQPYDFGEYRCRAENRLGFTFYDVTLERTYTPVQPKSVEIKDIYPDSVVVTVVDPDNTGGWPIDGYKIGIREEVFGVLTEHVFAKGELLDVTGLTVNTRYQVMVACRNPVGYGKYSDPLPFLTLDYRQPYTPIITSASRTQLTKSYKLEWLTPKDGGMEIRFYELRYRELYFSEEGIRQGNGYWIERSSIDSQSNTYVIYNLKPETSYELELWAVNSIEKGDKAEITVTTGRALPSPGPTKYRPGLYTVTPRKQVGAKGMSTGAIIGVVIAIFFILLILVDLTCYFMNSCGILHCLCVNLCGKEDTSEKEKPTYVDNRQEYMPSYYEDPDHRSIDRDDESDVKVPMDQM
ncbi:neural cell adhesion molecule 2-like isoform X4 [Ptychodera flava]|uniref:neural cell adhesion molecule 2-like isoform X4 n=1 Tax=Ptychodera flava TaxID=63121 RepID=UPI00396A4BA8